MLSFLLFSAIGLGMGSLAALSLVRTRGLKNLWFADQGDARVYRRGIDVQAVRNAYAVIRPY